FPFVPTSKRFLDSRGNYGKASLSTSPRSLHESRTWPDKTASAVDDGRNFPIENREHIMNMAGRSRSYACPRSSHSDRNCRVDQQPVCIRLGGASKALAGAHAPRFALRLPRPRSPLNVSDRVSAPALRKARTASAEIAFPNSHP